MVSANHGNGYRNPDFSRISRAKAEGVAPTFLTARGAYESHAETLSDGRTNTSRLAGTPYDGISWDEIRRLVDAPATRRKDDAQVVILSTYRGCDGRTHDAQREHGEFWGLAADIDTGNLAKTIVETAIRAVTGGAQAEIYSTSSSSPENRKWRVLVPLAAPISGEDYGDTQTAFFQLLAAHGVNCDPALARAAQPVYLPNVTREGRGRDGRPLFYQSQHITGPLLALEDGSPIVEARDALRARRAEEEAKEQARAEAARRQRRAYIEATGDDFHPVEHYNANHTIAATFIRIGFQPKPRKTNLYRHPQSKNGSYATTDHGDHWVCLSEWANTLNVGRPTRKGHRWGTAFDLHVAFDHGGDREAAVLAYVREVRPDLLADLQSAPARLKDFLAFALVAPPKRATVPVEELPDPGPARSVEELREEIAGGIAAALRQPGKIHLFRPQTGTGKTTLLLEGAVESRADSARTLPGEGETPAPVKFAMSLPTHANVREVSQAADMRDLQPGMYPERNEENCGEYARAAMAEAMGLNTAKAVCESCPLKDSCKVSGYLAASMAANSSEFKIGTHDRAVVAGGMTRDADAVVIDEDLFKVFAPTLGAEIGEIVEVRNWARAIRDDLHLDTGGRIVEADADQRLFADALVEVAGRILDAQDGCRRIDEPLTAEEQKICSDRREAAIEGRKHDEQHASQRRDEAKAEVDRIAKRRKEVEASTLPDREQIAQRLRDEAQQAEANLKQARKRLRAAQAALKRVSRRSVESFFDGLPRSRYESIPNRESRVIAVDLSSRHTIPDNWHATVFHWAERFGAGKGIAPAARKIIMLAAAGELESLYVVVKKNEGNAAAIDQHYVFARLKSKIPFDKPIIALDATADTQAIRDITGREVVDWTPAGHVPPIHDAFQITADLTADTSPDEAANILEAVMSKYWPDKQRAGIIGWQKAIRGMMSDGETLGEGLKAKIAKAAHFWEGPDRGSNTWITPVEKDGAGCDCLLVIGTPRAGTEATRMTLLAMGKVEAACLPDGDWGPRRWKGRRPTGEEVIIESAGYRNEEWHKAYCLIVRTTLQQNAGRARASLPDGIPVIIVSTEPTGLPVVDPLPVLETEVRHTVEAARRVRGAGSAIRPLGILKGHIALRGWVKTAQIAAALQELTGKQRTARKRAEGEQKRPNRRTAGIGRRAAEIRIDRAVEAGLLIRGGRGWVAVAGECDPWPSEQQASGKPATASPPPDPATESAETIAPQTTPSVVISAKSPAPPPSGAPPFAWRSSPGAANSIITATIPPRATRMAAAREREPRQALRMPPLSSGGSPKGFPLAPTPKE